MMVKTNGYLSKEPEDSGIDSSESNNSTGLTPAIGKMVLPVERKTPLLGEIYLDYPRRKK